MEDIEQLYITLRKSNLISDSFKEFVNLYQDDEYKQQIHSAAVGRGLYSSDFNKFTSDYAMPVAPTVPNITSVTDEILKIGSDVFDKLSVKLNTQIDDVDNKINQEIKVLQSDTFKEFGKTRDLINDLSKKIAIAEKQSELNKILIDEVKAEASNPLGG